MKKPLLIILLIFLILIFPFLFVRLISPKEIDDVSPGIFCSQEDLEKSEILWIIPKFNNRLISENKEWCDYILSLNKELGLHGITHEFEEFGTVQSQEYLQEGINIFEDCFGYKPVMFKPSQLKISEENERLVKENKMELKGRFNQIIHKVYHCDDTGTLSNWMIDLV